MRFLLQLLNFRGCCVLLLWLWLLDNYDVAADAVLIEMETLLHGGRHEPLLQHLLARVVRQLQRHKYLYLVSCWPTFHLFLIFFLCLISFWYEDLTFFWKYCIIVCGNFAFSVCTFVENLTLVKSLLQPWWKWTNKSNNYLEIMHAGVDRREAAVPSIDLPHHR